MSSSSNSGRSSVSAQKPSAFDSTRTESQRRSGYSRASAAAVLAVLV
jgi:hypothetical protein